MNIYETAEKTMPASAYEDSSIKIQDMGDLSTNDRFEKGELTEYYSMIGGTENAKALSDMMLMQLQKMQLMNQQQDRTLPSTVDVDQERKFLTFQNEQIDYIDQMSSNFEKETNPD